jgi:AcrR family transcriptional regulator
MMTVEGSAERVLRAYTDLLVERGIRNATFDAVSERAGLSKSGALHHFPSVARLQAALYTELLAQAEHDVEIMRQAPEGPLRYYLQSSSDRDSELERLLEACYRVAQTGDEAALNILRDCRGGWLDLLTADLGEPSLARMVLLVGDGLNYNALLSLPEGEKVLTPDHVEELISRFESLRAGRTSS